MSSSRSYVDSGNGAYFRCDAMLRQNLLRSVLNKVHANLFPSPFRAAFLYGKLALEWSWRPSHAKSPLFPMPCHKFILYSNLLLFPIICANPLLLKGFYDQFLNRAGTPVECITRFMSPFPCHAIHTKSVKNTRQNARIQAL